MSVSPRLWSSISEDNPIPKLFRRKLECEQMLVANVRLEKGCEVAQHRHESEQVAIILGGRALWRLGEPGTEEYQEIEVKGGEVLHLPSNFLHGLIALEDTNIIDVLSPKGPMGVDAKR